MATELPRTSGPSDLLIVSGTITNVQGKGIKEAKLNFFLNDQKVEQKEETTSAGTGNFKAELSFPLGTLGKGKVDLEAEKSSYKNSGKIGLDKIVKERIDEKGNVYYLAHQNISLARTISPAFWMATLILLAVYACNCL